MLIIVPCIPCIPNTSPELRRNLGCVGLTRSFGRLSLTRQGLLQRNNLVYLKALQAGVPTVVTMGGGYTKPMQRSVECHTDVYRAAAYRLNAWQVARTRGSGVAVAAVGR